MQNVIDEKLNLGYAAYVLLCTSGSAELIALGFLSLSFRRTADCRSLFYSSYGFELDGITLTHFRTSGLFSIRFLIRF